MASYCRWIMRLLIGLGFAGAFFIMKSSEQYLSKTIHNNPQNDLPQLNPQKYVGSANEYGWTNSHINNLYSGGLVDTVLPTKWDAYAFVTYNYYMVQIVLLDVGLASQVIISLTHLKQKYQIISDYFAPFKLQQFYKGNVQFKTSQLQFKLTKQINETHHMTSIKFKGFSGNKTLTGDLKQYTLKSNCMTFVRPYSSIKCLTGKSDGSVLINYKIINKEYKYQQQISDSWKFNQKVATVHYDGFRGSGYNWYWVWANGIGWNYNIEQGAVIQAPIKSAGISLGFMLDQQQNFIIVQNQVIKLKNVKYQIQDGMNKTNISFQSESPQGRFNFEIKQKYIYDDNMLIVHKKIEKAYGIWDGQIRFQNGTIFKFEKLFGFTEICKSRF